MHVKNFRLKVKYDSEWWKKLEEKSAMTSKLGGKAEAIKCKLSQKLIRFQSKFYIGIECRKTQNQSIFA